MAVSAREGVSYLLRKASAVGVYVRLTKNVIPLSSAAALFVRGESRGANDVCGGIRGRNLQFRWQYCKSNTATFVFVRQHVILKKKYFGGVA